MLAIAVGYHKAGQLNAALPWAKKAASKLDDVPLVHLNYGDLLLSIAEKTKDAAEAKPYFEKAVEQYDLVLKASANSVEAINNKAWILHTHLGRKRSALELANGFLKRVDPGPCRASSSTPSARSRRPPAEPARLRTPTPRDSANRPTTPS